MAADQFISNAEHRLLLAVALAAFIFSVAGSITYSVKADLKRQEFYREQTENKAKYGFSFSGPYCYPDKHPRLLFSIVLFTGAIFFSLLLFRRCLLSFVCTIVAFSLFAYWLSKTREILAAAESNSFKDVDRFFYNAGNFDLATGVLVSILLFWQFSILLRILIKTSQRKIGLP